MDITVNKLRELYDVICSRTMSGDLTSTQDRANIVRLLEKVSHSDFKDTRDFHAKAGSFFLKHIDLATTLHVYDNFIGTDPLVAKNIEIWAKKRKSGSPMKSRIGPMVSAWENTTTNIPSSLIPL